MSSYDKTNQSGRTSGGFSGAKDSGEVRKAQQGKDYARGTTNYPIAEEDDSAEDSK